MNKEHLFLRIVTYAPLIVIPVFIGLITFVFIEMYNYSFENNLKKIEENLYNVEKEAAEKKVHQMSSIITYKKSIIKKELKNRVKNRVEQAYTIAQTIYKENQNIKSQREIKREIKTALKSLSWNNGESYIWIQDYEGILILAQGSLKKLEGSSLLDFQDASGRYVIQEEIALCKDKGEGFLWDTFTKVTEDTHNQYKQVAFVKAFEHFGWYLGSSEHLDTATKKSNEILLRALKNIDEVNLQYLFVIDKSGEILINRTIPQYVGKNISEIDDNLTVNVVKQMISSLKNKNSDFLSYKWINLQNKTTEKKISFIQKIPDTSWILGSGFYLSDIQNKAARQKVDLYSIMYSKSHNILYLALITIVIGLIVSYYIGQKLKNSFYLYKEDISKNNIKLQELNATLEDKVKQRTKKLKEMSITDDLTHLYNRKHYNSKINKMISLYKRYSAPFSIIMYDIDDFKSINDTYGHHIGDKVLINMSKRVQSLLRDTDLLFRIGGEEFIILIPETSIEESFFIAEKIRKDIESLNIIEDRQITVSMGLTEVNDDDSEDSIFQRVDRLLYDSKRNGKNRVTKN